MGLTPRPSHPSISLIYFGGLPLLTCTSIQNLHVPRRIFTSITSTSGINSHLNLLTTIPIEQSCFCQFSPSPLVSPGSPPIPDRQPCRRQFSFHGAGTAFLIIPAGGSNTNMAPRTRSSSAFPKPEIPDSDESCKFYSPLFFQLTKNPMLLFPYTTQYHVKFLWFSDYYSFILTSFHLSTYLSFNADT